jgi:GDP-mannose 6-dehydrogenase
MAGGAIDMLAISVFGLGYVGSVTAACFASRGHKVIGIDVNAEKVKMLQLGNSPILEPGIQDLITAGVQNRLLSATLDVGEAVQATDVSFLCVGTPSQPNGKLDLKGIRHVCEQIGATLKTKKNFHVVVTRSTIIPGTTHQVIIPALEAASGKRAGTDFGVATNPEFMREGSAIKDFQEPPMTVLGVSDERCAQMLRSLYDWAPAELFTVDIPSAEMVKYACNTWHALKVAFANEVGTVCKAAGVEADDVIRIFLADKRLNISNAYLTPGFAFGGSCLPKDVRALNYRAKELDCKLPVIEAILPSNDEHIDRAFRTILAYGKKKIGLLGLSFKAGTDDLRESPQVHLMKRLLGEGYAAKIWDENVFLGRLIGSNRQYIEEHIPHIGSLLCERMEDVVQNADIILIGTKVDNAKLESTLRSDQTVIDLVNLHRQKRLKTAAAYAGIVF